MEKEENKRVYTAFKKSLEQFALHVHQLIEDAELSVKREFLEQIANDVGTLYESSVQVQQLQNEDAEEIGAIMQNIFMQPLAIKKSSHISMKKAVECFKPENEAESDLSYIMREYVKHPESTKSFVRELQLLSEDFSSILEEAG